MSIVSFRRLLLAAGVLLAWTPALVTAAPAAAAKVQADGSAEKIRAELDQVITVEITEQPLDLALKQLHELTKVNFVLDRFTINQLGFQPEQMPVNIKLKDVKLKSVLRSMLTPYNLNYAILGDTVVVSTDEMAMFRQMRQRVNLECEKEELASALKKLARETATNLIVDARAAKEAKLEVTMQMDDVPLETAVRLMSEMAGLKPVRVGNVLFVTTKASANELRADPDLAQPGGPRSPQELQMLQQQGVIIQQQPGLAVPQPAVAPGQPAIGTTPVAPPALDPEKPVEKDEKKIEEKPAAPPTPVPAPPAPR